MADSRTSQFIERIPVGPLALMPLQSIAPLGKKVNDYLVSWRTKRESEHKQAEAGRATNKGRGRSRLLLGREPDMGLDPRTLGS